MSLERGRTSGFAGPQAGLSLMEIVVALGIMAIAGVLFAFGYKALAKGTVEVGSTTDMQRLVKSLGHQLEGDMKRAGFGLGGAAAFSTLGAAEVAVNYKDLLGSNCAKGQVATVRYSLYKNSMIRELACDGKPFPKKYTAGGKDSLSLSFRYLDNAGKAVAASDKVRTVEYTIQVNSGKGTKKSRASSGSVSIVNNG